MADLQPQRVLKNNPLSLPFADEVPLELPKSGVSPVNRRAPKLDILPPKPKPKLKLIPDLKPLPSVNTKPAGKALSKLAPKASAAAGKLVPIGSKALGAVGAVGFFYDGVAFLESQAPGVQRWLKDGWKGATTVSPSSDFEGGQCVALYTVNIAWISDSQFFESPPGSTLTGSRPNIQGPIVGVIYVAVIARWKIIHSGGSQDTTLNLFGGNNPDANVQITSVVRNGGIPDDCGDRITNREEDHPDRPEDTEPPLKRRPIPIPIRDFDPSPIPIPPPKPIPIGQGDPIQGEADDIGNTEPEPEPIPLPPPTPTPPPRPDPDPTPPPSCSDPCLQPVANSITRIYDRLEQLERLADVFSVLAEALAIADTMGRLDSIEGRLIELEQYALCLENLYCDFGQANLKWTSCNGEQEEVYSGNVIGVQGLIQYLNKMDEFNQRRFLELCMGKEAPESVSPSLLFTATASAGNRIYDIQTNTQNIQSIRVDIVSYWDYKKDGTRVFNRDDDGKVNASFGVVSIGFQDGNDTYWLESENMFFDHLLIPVPPFMKNNCSVRCSMPKGTTFEVWDTGKRQ